MGLRKAGAEVQQAALQGFDDSGLQGLREQARGAQLANRKTFVARLPLPRDAGAAPTDVPAWSAALQQVGQFGWQLSQWSVCSEPQGPVAYAVFLR